MSIDWQNGAPDRGRTALPESYKPRALRLATAAAPANAAPAPVSGPIPGAPIPAPETAPVLAARVEAPTAEELASQEPDPVVDLRKLEAELGRKRLDEIADVVRLLTYGEMMELAESMWNLRNDSELSEDNLPDVLYRWSTSRQS